jgi:hypothetical protein
MGCGSAAPVVLKNLVVEEELLARIRRTRF